MSLCCKIGMSILPPVCIELGIVLLGKFESHFKQFHPTDYTKIYTNLLGHKLALLCIIRKI